jgi:hypothetical protein
MQSMSNFSAHAITPILVWLADYDQSKKELQVQFKVCLENNNFFRVVQCSH